MIEYITELLGMTSGQRIFGQNIVWLVYSLTVAILFSIGLRDPKRSEDAKILMLGIIWVAIASGLHRLYYTLFRWAEASDVLWLTEWLSVSDWTVASVVGVVIGYTFHLRTYLKSMLPRIWLISSLAFAAVLFLVTGHMLPG